MKIQSKEKLEGVWSGYDATNKIITTGHYSFSKIMGEAKIRDAKNSDIATLVGISKNEFGQNYIVEKEFKDIINKIGSRQVMVAEDKSRKKILGFVIYDIQKMSSFFEEYEISKQNKNIFVSVDKVGVIKSLCIDKEYHGRGIGTRLVVEIEKIFFQENILLVCIPAWQHLEGIPIQGILDIQKYNHLQTVENYWEEESVIYKYVCPYCGLPPCKCSLSMYYKNL